MNKGFCCEGGDSVLVASCRVNDTVLTPGLKSHSFSINSHHFKSLQARMLYQYPQMKDDGERGVENFGSIVFFFDTDTHLNEERWRRKNEVPFVRGNIFFTKLFETSKTSTRV